MNKLNFVFWGTPDVASETLEILKENGYIPSLIITALDKPQGRKMIITPPPVKVWAMENNVPYLQPESLPEAQLRGISPKLGFEDRGYTHSRCYSCHRCTFGFGITNT